MKQGRALRLFSVLGLLSLIGLSLRKPLFAKFEQEQLALEAQLQNRIEGILAKTLPPSSYLVTVKVEMDQRQTPQAIRNTQRRVGNNPFLGNNEFVLPGVPQKKEFVQQQDNTNETVVNAFSAETLVRKISISILVSPDIPQEQIRGIRDVISASIPFNPLRGDELDVQGSSLLKRVNPSSSSSSAVSMAMERAASRNLGESVADRINWPVVAFLGAAILLSVVLLVFLFGPVRAFLNRLLAVLPRVGEQAAYAVSNSSAKPGAGNGVTAGSAQMNSGLNGHVNGNGEALDLPFQFIREDQLTKLPILFRQMPPQQVALVLAYLPPEWASRVLGGMDASGQTAVMAELSQAREVPPEIVKDVELQIKTKLPYLVGGVDWIQSVYQLTQPQTQQALLGTLNQQSPELAQTLRKKSFFFEDLGIVNPGALRLIVQDVGYPTFAAAMKNEKPELRDGLLRRLPAATREILQQELEMSNEDRATIEISRERVVSAARRLIADGRLTMPEKK